MQCTKIGTVRLEIQALQMLQTQKLSSQTPNKPYVRQIKFSKYHCIGIIMMIDIKLIR